MSTHSVHNEKHMKPTTPNIYPLPSGKGYRVKLTLSGRQCHCGNYRTLESAMRARKNFLRHAWQAKIKELQ